MNTPKSQPKTRVRSFKPTFDDQSARPKVLFNSIPAAVLTSRTEFIEMSRKGIPGAWVRDLIQATGLREMFLSILDVSSSNLYRVYRKKALPRKSSEEVLDTVRVLSQAAEVWASFDIAKEWLKRPVPALGGERPISLFDTFEGRRWVAQALSKIEHGEFS